MLTRRRHRRAGTALTIEDIKRARVTLEEDYERWMNCPPPPLSEKGIAAFDAFMKERQAARSRQAKRALRGN